MRTIYTDRYGIGLLVPLLLALGFSYRAVNEEQTLSVLIFTAAALASTSMFIKDLRCRIAAHRAGEDSTIIRIVDSAQN